VIQNRLVYVIKAYMHGMRGGDTRERAEQIGDSTLLELIGDVCGLLEIAELRRELLAAMHRVLPSEYVSLNEIGATPDQVLTIQEPDFPEMLLRWTWHAHENPLLQYHQRTRDGRAYRFSDVISHEELHALPLYEQVYKPMGVEYQMAFTLPAREDRVLAIALSRGERDYSDAERDFTNRARPFLIQAYLNAVAYDELRSARAGLAAAPDVRTLMLAGLTAREAEVVGLLALGRSNQHIAAELQISDRTVGKHLEHCFRKLGVADRSNAAARAWELAERAAEGRDPLDAAPPHRVRTRERSGALLR
jgi:DNA-binding CsgD family transcriptional regulator